MQKAPKFYLENRTIVPLARRQRKEALSSAGRNKESSPARIYGPIHLNRSAHWPHCQTYKAARESAIKLAPHGVQHLEIR